MLTVTEYIRDAVASKADHASFEVLGVLLLIGLLIVKNLILASGRPEVRSRAQMLNIAIAPLLLAFILVITLRAVPILLER